MFNRLERKTIFIIAGILFFFIMALMFGFHMLWPALDPISADMIKIFASGAGCGLLAGLWLGLRIERDFNKHK